MVLKQPGLALNRRPAGGEVDIRLAKIAVPLGNLVLEHRRCRGRCSRSARRPGDDPDGRRAANGTESHPGELRFLSSSNHSFISAAWYGK